MVLKGDFYIKLENVRVYATQDTGYVTCVEVMNAENSKGRCETTTCPMLGFNTLCSLACCAVRFVTGNCWICPEGYNFGAWRLMLLCRCRTIATNIFEKQNGDWKMVLHQGGPLPTFA